MESNGFFVMPNLLEDDVEGFRGDYMFRGRGV